MVLLYVFEFKILLSFFSRHEIVQTFVCHFFTALKFSNYQQWGSAGSSLYHFIETWYDTMYEIMHKSICQTNSNSGNACSSFVHFTLVPTLLIQENIPFKYWIHRKEFRKLFLIRSYIIHILYYTFGLWQNQTVFILFLNAIWNYTIFLENAVSVILKCEWWDDVVT